MKHYLGTNYHGAAPDECYSLVINEKGGWHVELYYSPNRAFEKAKTVSLTAEDLVNHDIDGRPLKDVIEEKLRSLRGGSN
jgi:hypothetical protein